MLLAPPSLAETEHTLRGRALDAGGNPVAGVSVQVASPEGLAGAALETRSAEHGRFVLPGLPAGTHTLRVVREGFVSREISGVRLPSRQPLAVRLEKLARLRGVVMATDGQAFRVLVSLAGGSVTAVETGAGGRFALDALPPGPIEIQAHSLRPPWRASAIRRLHLRGLREVMLSWGPAARATGSVGALASRIGDSPRPVAEAKVVLLAETARLMRFETVSDSEGDFSLPPTRLGAYRLAAWADGLLPAVGVSVNLPRATPIRLTLRRGVLLRGQVVGASGTPLSDVIVRALGRGPGPRAAGNSFIGELGVIPGPVPPIPTAAPRWSRTTASGHGFWSTLTDARGRFQLTALPRREIGLMLAHEGYRSVTIERVVLDRETAAHGAQPVRLASCDDAVSGRSRSSSEQRYRACRAHPLADPARFTLGRLVMQPVARLTVRVLDERRFPLPGSDVVFQIAGRTHRLTTNHRGEASFPVAQQGAASISAAATGFQPSRLQVQLPIDNRRPLELVLAESAGELRGRIVDRRGAPLAGAKIALLGSAASVVADASGAFRLGGLASGRNRIRVSCDGFAPLERPVRVGETLEIGLQPLRSLSGHVADWRTGSAISVFRLQRDRGAARTVRHANGRFTLQLAPGTHRLTVVAHGYAPLTRSLSIPHESSRSRLDPLELQLKRAGTLDGRVVDARGEPAANATVSCATASTTTKRDGSFRLDGIPTGKDRTLVVRTADGVEQRWPAVVYEGNSAAPLLLQLRNADDRSGR
jgi:hypothetical protein